MGGGQIRRDLDYDLFSEDVPEELDSRGLGTGVEADYDDSDLGIVEPFAPEQIDVITRTPTVDLILSRIRNGQIDLQPDFQRHAGIWTPAKKSRLIESLLLRIPLPTFYVAESEDESWTVIDGIQRLTTITQFMDSGLIGKEPMRLRSLEYLDRQYGGVVFSQLPGRLQTRLRETELVMHLIRSGTPEAVMFNIFVRINTGGLPLTRQELRHALIPGAARGILKDWAESSEFRAATGDSVRSDRMADREMVLRFIAFLLTSPERYRSDDFDKFLRDSMRALNQKLTAEIARLRRKFSAAMEAANAIFGPFAFRKLDPAGDRRLPINKALFEAVSVNLTVDSHRNERLVIRRERVMEGMRDLMKNVAFQQAISQGTGDVAKVKLRFECVGELFRSVAR